MYLLCAIPVCTIISMPTNPYAYNTCGLFSTALSSLATVSSSLQNHFPLMNKKQQLAFTLLTGWNIDESDILRNFYAFQNNKRKRDKTV